MAYQFRAELVLNRDLLGPHATKESALAPVLSRNRSEYIVEARKPERFVFGISGRRMDDLPGHAGSFGRYWTWVAHPDQNQTLAFIPRRTPNTASYLEGHLRLYRLHFRPLRGDMTAPLRISPPCIVVAGLGAVEIGGEHGSTMLAKPEPLAKFDLDQFRNQIGHIPNTKTRLRLPCALPNSPGWMSSEEQAVQRLVATLEMAYKQDPPDWLLLPCYLPESVPGLILARRQNQSWTFVSLNLDLQEANSTRISPIESSMQRGVDVSTTECVADVSSSAQWSSPPPFVYGDYVVHFENKAMLAAAHEKVLKGLEYRLDDEKRHRPASAGAWRRAACVYALQIRRPIDRDLRDCRWAESMARCIETFAEDIGPETLQWFDKKDGPSAFARFFTVRCQGHLAIDAREALAGLLDTLVRPHGRVRLGA